MSEGSKFDRLWKFSTEFQTSSLLCVVAGKMVINKDETCQMTSATETFKYIKHFKNNYNGRHSNNKLDKRS